MDICLTFISTTNLPSLPYQIGMGKSLKALSELFRLGFGLYTRIRRGGAFLHWEKAVAHEYLRFISYLPSRIRPR